ncbi:uncharacterized protein J4E88_006603 [Alternaria novae-zelandiae]|uniref:uncharacterized protein n=1 Tax=Alternaria novae-zelandiae TaxID=430562 RepID=UPI0020C3C875|nr:uncharacterized protein J4E88_006603 [Alternaria novae-zelandiae]XP_051355869.1 uncharacterized protein J4E92_002789 [Alternaria infectoria]KAI4678084.1 hypothetical protein J4E88_006603 [Alternaria novae-zelandiae]KAI4935499.1 hypothetical protein J4E92_002789 [Alternaria infectoria]
MSLAVATAAPTFSALNKPQKRALILRDQLRYVDPTHLNTFIEGLSNDEPPTYTRVNGVVKPDLVFVTLKEEATRFDLGNVILPEEKNAIHRIYLVVEDNQVQMHVEDPLPLEEDELDSHPIHGFIARGMLPLFKEKYQILYMRVNKINGARRAAYNMPYQAPVLFDDGESLTRLNPMKAENDRTSTHTRKSRKRRPNDEVIPHISNKRKRAGLDIIPEDVKSNIFNTIPSNIKVDLFNSVVKTAFPNFNNLMIASWNVVTIYSSCGSDFPELHTAIVDLKSVLQDFDETFGQRVDRVTPSYRHDFGGPSRDREDGNGDRDRDSTYDQSRRRDHQDKHSHRDGNNSRTPVPSFVRNGVENSEQLGNATANDSAQFEDDMEVPVDDVENIDDVAEPKMSPPHALQSSQPHGDSDDDSDNDSDDDDDEIPPVDPHSTRRLANQSVARHSHPKRTPETRDRGSVTTSEKPSPGPQYTHAAREVSGEPQEQFVDEADAEDSALVKSQTAGSELARRREEYASSVQKKSQIEAPTTKPKAASSPRNAAIPEQPLVDEADSHAEHDQPVPQLDDSPPAIPTSSSSSSPSSPPPLKKRKKDREAEYSVAQLEKKYQERKAHILYSFQNDMNKVPAKARKNLREMEVLIEQRKKYEAQEQVDKSNSKSGQTARPGTTAGGMFGNYNTKSLGKSMLGPKKPTGIAPVAPMFPNGIRKDQRDSLAKGPHGSTPPYSRGR